MSEQLGNYMVIVITAYCKHEFVPTGYLPSE